MIERKKIKSSNKALDLFFGNFFYNATYRFDHFTTIELKRVFPAFLFVRPMTTLSGNLSSTLAVSSMEQSDSPFLAFSNIYADGLHDLVQSLELFLGTNHRVLQIISRKRKTFTVTVILVSNRHMVSE